jgi:HK97 family phage prohead protease
MLLKMLPTIVTKAGPRTFTFVVSTGQLDRDKDRIPVQSWSLEAFKANPAILWGHNHNVPAIGRAVNVRTTRTAVTADIEFPPEGIHPLADTVHGLVSNGFLKATSVGFRPSAWTPNEFGGKDFQFPCELLEISVVNLPANPGALLEQRDWDAAAVTKWLGSSSEDRDSQERLIWIEGPHHYHKDDELYFEYEPTFDVDARELRRLVSHVVSETVVELAQDALQEKLDYQLGRVR